MGNKCCSKRQHEELPTTGYKKTEAISSNFPNPNSNSIDSRYTPDPNRGSVTKHTKSGIDIIRSGPRNISESN